MIFRKKDSVEDLERALLPHLDDLFRTAKGVFSSEDEAAFIVRKTYLQVLKSGPLPKAEGACRAWLFQILFQMIHRHRVKVLRFESVNFLNEGISLKSGEADPLPERLEEKHFISALNRLPTVQRAILQLIDVEDFSYRETSDLLGIPMETVRSLLGSGRTTLRRELILETSDTGNQLGLGPQPGRIF